MDETFVSDGARITADLNGLSVTNGAGGGEALEVRYESGNPGYTISISGGAEDSFDLQSDRSLLSNDLNEVFRTTDGDIQNTLVLTKVGSESKLQTRFVAGGTLESRQPNLLNENASISAFTFGVATAVADVPVTGDASFAVGLNAVTGVNGESLGRIYGSGVVTVDFATNSFSGNGTISSRSTFSTSGVLSSGKLVQGTLVFPFRGLPDSQLDGRFFGPGAAEFGATFSGINRGILSSGEEQSTFISGTLVGVRGNRAPVLETLSDLFTPTSLRRLNKRTYREDFGQFESRFDSGSESTLIRDTVNNTIELQNDPVGVLGEVDRVAEESNTRFTVYRKTVNGDDTTYSLFNPGDDNDELALDFVSFGLIDGSSPFSGDKTFVYGLTAPSAVIPLTGRGSYAGVLYGDASSIPDGGEYDLRGNAALEIDFGAASLTGSLTASATNQSTGSVSNLGTFTVNGSGTGRLDTSGRRPINSAFMGDITGQPGSSGSLIGNFFGPEAEEIGATFQLITPGAGTILIGTGAIVASRDSFVDELAQPPAPAPAPPSNISLDPLTVSDVFRADEAVRSTAVYPGLGSSPVPTRDALLDISYDATTQSYTVTEGNIAARFTPADRDMDIANPLFDLFSVSQTTVTDTLRLTKTGADSASRARYAGGGVLVRSDLAAGLNQNIVDAFIYGVPTETADIPLTGSASFGIVLTGIEAKREGLALLNGSGLVNLDFLTGALSGSGTTYSRGLEGESAKLLRPGSFTLEEPTGGNGSSDLSAQLLFRSADTYSGLVAGQLYGPEASEIGLTFGVTSGAQSTISGVMIGSRGTEAPAYEILTSLQGDTLVSGGKVDQRSTIDTGDIEGGLSERFDANAELSADLQRYRLDDDLGSENATPAMSDDRFTAYQVESGGRTNSYRVYKAGSDNVELALSYTNFVLLRSIAPSSERLDRASYFGLGGSADNLPRTGNGSYSGVLYGTGLVAGPGGDYYDLTGTAAFDFDWQASTFNGNLTATASNQRTLAASDLGIFSFTNGVTGSSTNFTANISGPSGTSGSLNGNFFGPTGQELGATFQLNTPFGGGDLLGQGVIAAKRQ